MSGPAESTGLGVEGLTIRYGGNTAVADVDLRAAARCITGLIGPNGAGKTTIFNACSGLLHPSAGVVRFDGRDITRLPPHRRAQLGLGRTFQRMELFDSLTVRENIALGREAGYAGSRPIAHLLAPRHQAAAVAAAVEQALAVCRIEDLADQPVVSLSTGQRRLVELARAMAADTSLLLLDEPSSGLDHTETGTFGDVLLGLVRDRRIGILLVEHDMSLVMRICDWLFVLDFGRLIFEGTPKETAASEVVRHAYLGTADEQLEVLQEVPS